MNMERTQKVCTNGHPMEVDWGVCPYCPGPEATNPGLARTVMMDATGLRPAGAPPAPAPAHASPVRKTEIMERPPRIEGVAWLVAADGPGRGRTHHIEKARALLGAAAGCDIVLEGDHVSDQHASVRFHDGGFALTDLDSTNGTRVNGEDVHQRRLEDGDRVSLGGTEWVFKCVVFEEA
jgi:hypothetical protein